MGEESTPKPLKPTLEVGLIAGLTIAANRLENAEMRQLATTAAPFAGAGFAWLIRQAAQYIRYRRLLRLEKSWLATTEAERKKPGLSRVKQNALDQEITRRKQAIEQMQRDNLRLQ